MEERKLNVLEFTDTELIYCVGDIHGNFKALKGFIHQNDIHDSLIIVCGDCGLGFESRWHYEQNVFPGLIKVLTEYNDRLVLVRGNHDDPSSFKMDLYDYDRLKVVPDYTVINTFFDQDKQAINHSILCIGGATSIDRTYRKQLENQQILKKMKHGHCTLEEAAKNIKRLYWSDEAPIYDADMLDTIIKMRYPIDIVCTHTAPSFCHPITKNGIDYWLRHDKTLEKDLNDERKVFDDIYRHLKDNGVKLEKWCYGHFHTHKTERIDGVIFCLLDMEKGGKLDAEVIV